MASKKASWILGINGFEGSFPTERRLIAQEARASYGTNTSIENLQVHPQATTDPLDPLNWTALKKHTILGIVMWLYFMFTYITTTTVPSFPEIQKLYNLTYSEVNWTVGAPSLGLALGPLIWSSLSDIYGRRVVFVVGTTMAFVATIGTAVSKTYASYMIARFFQGLGASPGGTVGMAIIGDLFFDYERGQKLGLWVLAINSGLFIGPIVGGLIDLVSPFWVDWLTAILFGALLIMELAFLPETLYPRNYMLAQRVPSPTCSECGSTVKSELKRTSNLSFINFQPIPGIRHSKPWDSMLRFFLTFKFPAVVLSAGIFCFAWYWWVLSVVTFIPAAYAQYSPSIQGLMFLGLLLGSWFAELFCSGRLSDWIVQILRKKNGGVQVAETRLWLAYPAALLSAIGLIIWGVSIDKHCHWMVGQIAFFLFAMGIQMGNTVIPTYIVDCYPLQSMSVITFYSIFLDLSAFINPFFIAAWVTKYGYTMTFVVQGLITVFVAVPVIALVHKFGPTMRARSGLPAWLNSDAIFWGCGIVAAGRLYGGGMRNIREQ